MASDNTISFQTDSDTVSALEKIAREGGQNVSAVVESIVRHYLKDNRDCRGLHQNRRCLERKKVRIPAFIGDPRWQRKNFESCSILDISFGGVLVSVPKGTKIEFENDGSSREVRIIFTLEDCPWPVNLKCHLKRVNEADDEVRMGATLVDPDFHTFTTLQRHLI